MIKKSEKNYNYDFLKVIATLMVIILHYLNTNIGGALGNTIPGTFNYYASYFLESLCIVAVNLFVLISGYFLIDKKEVKFSKAINLFLSVIIYCVLMYIIVLFLGNSNISSLIEFINSILEYWYVYIYIILYLMTPFLNRLLNSLSRKDYKVLLIILFCFFSVWPTFLNNVTVMDNGYGIINFVFLYMVGAYIKKNDLKFENYGLILYLIFSLFTFGFSLVSGRAYRYNSVFVILASISLFGYFKNLRIDNSFYKKISNYSLDIYIIHLLPMLRLIVFREIFNCQNYYYSPYFIIHLFLTIFLIFIFSLFFSILKSKIIDKFLYKLLKKLPFYNFKYRLE